MIRRQLFAAYQECGTMLPEETAVIISTLCIQTPENVFD